MADTHKPRHIRDIAHLYISRLPQRGTADTKDVLVVGVARECFPGYHTANIAAGLAKSFSVRLVEISGLWPCSAHFLSLRPQVYLRRKDRLRTEQLSALGNINICFSIPGERSGEPARAGGNGRTRSRAGAIDLYHLPPVEDHDELEKTLTEGLAFMGPHTQIALLASNELNARTAWKSMDGLWGNAVQNTIILAANSMSQDKHQQELTNTRYLTNWRKPLCDNVPCVVRAPDSYLSRTYMSICGELSSPPLPSRGKHASNAAQRSTAPGPAW